MTTRIVTAVLLVAACATPSPNSRQEETPLADAALTEAKSRADAKDFDGAAEALAAVIIAPEPPRGSLLMLHVIHGSLSAAERQRLAALGTTMDKPIFVRDMRLEYAWTAEFACADGPAKLETQSLFKGPGKGPNCALDGISFTCGNGNKSIRYFDYSADPRDKELRKRLAGFDPCKEK